jgi:hypothetical protein
MVRVLSDSVRCHQEAHSAQTFIYMLEHFTRGIFSPCSWCSLHRRGGKCFPLIYQCAKELLPQHLSKVIHLFMLVLEHTNYSSADVLSSLHSFSIPSSFLDGSRVLLTWPQQSCVAVYCKTPKCGVTYLQFQHSGGWGRRIESWKPTWATKQECLNKTKQKTPKLCEFPKANVTNYHKLSGLY